LIKPKIGNRFQISTTISGPFDVAQLKRHQVPLLARQDHLMGDRFLCGPNGVRLEQTKKGVEVLRFQEVGPGALVGDKSPKTEKLQGPAKIGQGVSDWRAADGERILSAHEVGYFGSLR
jgi:hypothetical protein